MKVLIGCEESQKVCKAFRDRGHEAYSCDIQATRGSPDWHFQQDIMTLLTHEQKWDLIILHPDCTAMAVSGNRWYGKGMPLNGKRIEAVRWTRELWIKAVQVCNFVALENPVSVIFTELKKLMGDIQYIQPYHFGHKEYKKTGLALHNLPELKYFEGWEQVKMFTDLAPKHESERIWRMAPSEKRKRDRSETYQGIADAMADQWVNQ